MYVATQEATFPITQGSGPQSSTQTVHMPGLINQAVAILTGFDVEYSHGQDHHLGRLDIEVNVGAINGADVSVTIVYGLRDWSNDWDDAYDGTVRFAVVAE